MGYRERYRHMRRLGYSVSRARRGAKSACYIATSIYGSYDCPEVWTLRRFRDFKLSKSFFGRVFIRLYYFASPTLVKLFGKTKFFQRFWKKYLNKKVAKLNEKGFSNLPYSDKNNEV